MVKPKKVIQYICNDTVIFQCAVGHVLKGPTTLTCQAKNGTQNGVWDNNQPRCVHECKLSFFTCSKTCKNI